MDTPAQAKGATKILFLKTQSEAKSIAISRNVTGNEKIIYGLARKDDNLQGQAGGAAKILEGGVHVEILTAELQEKAGGIAKILSPKTKEGMPDEVASTNTQGQAEGAAKILFLKTQDEAKSAVADRSVTDNGKNYPWGHKNG